MSTNKYHNGLIYKIICKDSEISDIYVGSSVDFIKRKNSHKSRTNNINSEKYNLYVYKFIRENGGWDNWEMLEITKYSCESRLELETEERKYMELLKSTLNIHIPTRTMKEWRQDNTEKYKEKKREYYQTNKDKMRETSKNYYNDNKETILETQKEYSKKYRDNNKEKVLKTQKKYRDNNREKLQQKVNCECGGKYTHNHKSRHSKTIKHQSYLATIKDISSTTH